MTDGADLAAMLAGGRPNSLGRTVEAVERVLAANAGVDGLLDCYRSSDELVRLRASNALKRVDAVRPDWIASRLDRVLAEVGALDQASAQWTTAQLLDRHAGELGPDQRRRATALLQNYLERSGDWIVLGTTMATLTRWAKDDPALAAWLPAPLRRLADDPRGSVSAKARKALAALS